MEVKPRTLGPWELAQFIGTEAFHLVRRSQTQSPQRPTIVITAVLDDKAALAFRVECYALARSNVDGRQCPMEVTIGCHALTDAMEMSDGIAGALSYTLINSTDPTPVMEAFTEYARGWALGARMRAEEHAARESIPRTGGEN